MEPVCATHGRSPDRKKRSFEFSGLDSPTGHHLHGSAQIANDFDNLIETLSFRRGPAAPFQKADRR